MESTSYSFFKSIKQKNQDKDGPRRIPKTTLCVNLTQCKFSLFEKIFKRRNWRIIKNDYENLKCDLIFSNLSNNQNLLQKMKPYQKINNFPGIVFLAKKSYLGNHLNNMKKKYPKEYNIFPDTYSLPYDRSKLLKQFQNCKRKTFILKPEFAAEGRGIFLVRKLEDIDITANLVCQKYINNPLLIDNKKFDLRIYVLITSIDPLTIYMYNDGLVRLSTIDYNKPDDKNIKNIQMHLTNYSIQKRTSEFFTSKNDSNFNTGFKRDFQSIKDLLNNQGVNPEQVFDKIKQALIKTIISVQPIMKQIYKSCQPEDFTQQMCFNLLGFDVMIDDNLNPQIIEVNHVPSMNTDSLLDKKIKTNMLNSLVDILSFSIERRNYFINLNKKKMKERILQGKRKKISIEERNSQQNEYQKKFHYEKNYGLFEQIYPCNKFKNKYEQFLKYAEDLLLQKNGLKNKKRKTLSVKNVQKVKTAQSVQQIRITKKVKTNNQKMIMINNSINRLYRNVCRDKENYRYNRTKSFKVSELKPEGIQIKASVVNIDFNL